MDVKQVVALIEERRKRDVVISPGASPNPPRTPGDATQFDPVLRKAVELLEPPAPLQTRREPAAITPAPRPTTAAHDG